MPRIECSETKINSSLSLAKKWGLPVEVVRWEDMLYPEMQVTEYASLCTRVARLEGMLAAGSARADCALQQLHLLHNGAAWCSRSFV